VTANAGATIYDSASRRSGLLAARIETPEQKLPTIYRNSVIPSGGRKRFDLPHREWENLHLQQNIQLTLFCETTTEKFEQSKVYTLFLTDGSKLMKVRKGLRGVWTVGCPKCNKVLGICMVTDDLKTFDEPTNVNEKWKLKS
jgi:hypothetical protein